MVRLNTSRTSRSRQITISCRIYSLLEITWRKGCQLNMLVVGRNDKLSGHLVFAMPFVLIVLIKETLETTPSSFMEIGTVLHIFHPVSMETYLRISTATANLFSVELSVMFMVVSSVLHLTILLEARKTEAMSSHKAIRSMCIELQ